MGTNFPTNLDNFTNPSSTDSLSSPDHATQHADVNDAVEALEAKVGINNSAVTTSLDYRVRNPSLVGGAARPLLTGGAYLDGTTGLVLGAVTTGNHASAPDSAALSITGDIDIKMKIKLANWAPSSFPVFVGKANAAGTIRGFEFGLSNLNALRLVTSVDGTATTVGVSTVATGIANNTTKWIRATLDVNDGAGNRVYKFYTSDDGTTWTQLGTTVTTAGTTSIFDNSIGLGIGARGSEGVSNGLDATISRVIIQNAYDTTDNTTSVVFDANFETQTADALAFRASSNSGIKADGLVLQGRSGEYASTPDSAALSITGDIDIKVKATMTDWTPSSGQVLIAKRQNTVTHSYVLSVNTNGTLRMESSPDGLQANIVVGTSTVATGITDGTSKWVRATLDVNDGAGNRVYKFYTSDDGTTWTQLGTTVTTAGTTSIFDSVSPLEVGSAGLGATAPMIGTVGRAIIQSAFDTANNTSNLAFDADFDAQPAGTTSFNESSSNAALVTVVGCDPVVTINTTRYHFGIPGAMFTSLTAANIGINNTFFNYFRVDAPIVVDMAMFEVSTSPASTSTAKMAVYATDNNFNPVGSPVIDFGSVSVPTSPTGVFTKQITPVTLQPGSYVTAWNNSVAFSVRHGRGGMNFTRLAMGTSGLIDQMAVTQTNAAFPSSSPVPTVIFPANAPTYTPFFLRWRAA